MKRLSVILAAGLLAAAIAGATPTPGACAPTTLNNYLASGFACTIDNLMFSNFGYTGTAAPPGDAISAGSIGVTPITLAFDEGFTFNSGWNESTQLGVSAEQDSDITFTVSTVNGTSTLDDLALAFNGSSSGTGRAGVTEQVCLGAATVVGCSPSNMQSLSVFVPPPNTHSAATLMFAPPEFSELSVSKDINVTSGIDGNAMISSVTNQFSQTPEPGTLFLMATGLMGAGLIRRRRRS